jgi:predicted N-acetyltransferase YhbS
LALDTLALDFAIGLETPALSRRVVELSDRAFGPGRFVKTAERLREDSQPIEDLSFVAMQGDRLLGSVRLWPAFVYDEAEHRYEPLVFLGPVVVEAQHRSQGIGRALIRTAIDAAFAKGLRAVILVGSQSYFAPFGFEQALDVTMPGPVDPKRVLIRYREAGLKLHGRVIKVV